MFVNERKLPKDPTGKFLKLNPSYKRVSITLLVNIQIYSCVVKPNSFAISNIIFASYLKNQKIILKKRNVSSF